MYSQQFYLFQFPMFAFRVVLTFTLIKEALLTSPASFPQHQNLQFMYFGTMETRLVTRLLSKSLFSNFQMHFCPLLKNGLARVAHTQLLLTWFLQNENVSQIPLKHKK